MVGSLSAVGEIVYVSEFTDKTTSGFTMKTGRRVFHYPKGTYTPVISDGHRIFLTGYSSITALEPVTRAQLRRAARRQAARAKRKAEAKASARASQPRPGAAGAAAAGAARP